MCGHVGNRIISRLGVAPIGSNANVVGLKCLLERIEDHALMGSVKFIPGIEWQPALEAKHADDTQLPPDVDRSMLHVSRKRKSTYTGVFSHGSRFKARARHHSSFGEIELGSSYATAELAALARYYYYLEHESLCYGEAEEEVLAMRQIDPNTENIPDAELWPQVVEHLQITGRYEHVFALGQVLLVPGPREPQLAARRARQVIVDASHWANIRAQVEATTDAQTPGWRPTWEGLTKSQQSEPAPELASRAQPRRGRPRKHVQNGADSCACGNQWPCSRARYKTD